MTTMPSAPRNELPADRESSVGLRFRLWLGCLGGALVGAGGMAWVVSAYLRPNADFDLASIVSWLSAVAGLGILVGIACALWLDSGIVGHLRGLSGGLASGRLADLRSLPAGAGWGELSRLTRQLQGLLTLQRQAVRTAEELGMIHTQIGVARDSLERWLETERWDGVRIEAGALVPLVESLDRGLRRLDEVRDENVEATRQMGVTVGAALAEARETAGEAERGFVEATALLTTVRELQRLGGELDQSLATSVSGSHGDDATMFDAWRAGVRAAIDELIESSSGSVEHLGRGLSRVQEIADQVHLVANRATLIALNAALALARQGRQEAGVEESSAEMKRLAAEVRGATDRTTALSREIEAEVATAIERMRGVRQRVTEKLEEIPSFDDRENARAAEPSRLLERVKEMVQDAAQKGERMSAAGERVSRAAERLVRRLEEEVQELAGLLVRLSPPEAPSQPAEPTGATDQPSTGTGLKLLDEERPSIGSQPRDARVRPGGQGARPGERP